jgi:DNA-3-methyladenine glycosylase II
MPVMTPKLHRRFVKLSGEFSPQLQQHIKRVGPIGLDSRKHLGIAQFLARVIIGQQVSTKAAATIWGRVKDAARESDQKIPGFFCEANVNTLRACGVSGNKTKALLAINEACVDRRLSPARLRRLDAEARAATLIDIRGVGQWTVDMALMFYFGETDIWPEGDLSVSRTFSDFLSKKDARRRKKILAEFSPHRSYLAVYMWRVLDNPP